MSINNSEITKNSTTTTKEELKNILSKFVEQIFPNDESFEQYLKFAKSLKISTFTNPTYEKDDIKNVYFHSIYEIDNQLKLSETIENIYTIGAFKVCSGGLLEDFCRRILYEIKLNNPNNTTNIEIINNEIEKFIDYLDKIPQEINYLLSSYNLKIYSNLDGKICENFEIANSDSAPFRKEYLLEFKLTLPLKEKNYFRTKKIFEKLLSIFDLGYIILKEKSNDLDEYLDYGKSFLESKTQLYKFPNILPFYWQPSIYSYNLDENKLKELQEFICHFKPLLEKLDRDDFINIAIDFYRDGLNKDNSIAQIAYGVIALEALYNTDKSDLIKTLTQRCSKVLGYFYGSDALKIIIKDLKNAYNIRSGYVHGGKKYEKEKEKNNVSNLARRILNYARLSIIIFLQLSNNSEVLKEKEVKKYINKDLIDNSLIHKDFDKELEKLLCNCKLFNNPNLLFIPNQSLKINI